MALNPRDRGADPKRLAAVWSTPAKVHPLLSALAFEKSTRETNGATMDVRTGELYPVGTPKFLVGGAPARGGGPVPTESLSPNELNPATILQQRSRVRRESADPDAALGSWGNDETGKIDFDASNAVVGKRDAKRLGYQRGERAIFSLREAGDIRLRKARNPKNA